MTHAAESLHWYAPDGKPAHTVKAKDGSDRPTTLRDAKKYGFLPSVTSVIQCASKPGLENWKQQQVLLAALTLPRREDEPEPAYIARIMADSKEQAKKAAERGTAIHAAIQGHYEGEPPHEDLWPYVNAAKEQVSAWIGANWTPEWMPEISFAHPAGFGGKVDLAWKGGAILDFKTKEFGQDDELKTWDEHHMQLAAYRLGLGLPEARCAICYVSASNPGIARVVEVEEEDLKRGLACFVALLDFWKAKNRYWPSAEKKAA